MSITISSLQFTGMGYSKEHITSAFTEVSRSHPNKDVSSLWPAVLCHLREEQVYGAQPESQGILNNCCLISAYTVTLRKL